MALNSPKILTFRFVPADDGSKVVIEFGVKTIEKNIPSGQGVVRASAIFNDKGELSEMELITEKS